MKKCFFLTIFIALAWRTGFAQSKRNIDSLKHLLSVETKDTNRVNLLYNLSYSYWNYKPDSALKYGQRALELSRHISFKKGEAYVLLYLGLTYNSSGDSPEALELFLKALKIAETNHLDNSLKGQILYSTGFTYLMANEYSKALTYMRQAHDLFISLNSSFFISLTEIDIAKTFLKLNKLDSASKYGQLAYRNMIRFNTHQEYVLDILGMIYTQKGDSKQAMGYFQQSLAAAVKKNDYRVIADSYYGLAKVYQQTGRRDSCIDYAQKALAEAKNGAFYLTMIDASELLASLYEGKDWQKAFQYNKMSFAANDSLYTIGKRYAFNNITDFDEKERQYEIETAKTAYKNKMRQTILLASLGIFLLIAFILYWNNRQRRKANNLLAHQKEKVESTLIELKNTQSQLIQREKMASLGELTAGIAHEIQNPLNFVNNFSDVNQEMLDELEQELDKGDIGEAKAIAADIKQNEQKINHHGKRADFIVKGMLEHSRTNTGEKQLTNMNVLCDEFLKLSYHGLRAKNKSFNAEMVTHYDPHLPQINVSQQDMGRVLLNLFNNAFYAVSQKQKTSDTNYKPGVSVTTVAEHGQVIIKVKDNGTGIPDSIKEKIMQPFFTTKPTGEGTGLGLSLTYDMVVKGHGGSIKVDTKEDEYTEFTVSLPLCEV